MADPTPLTSALARATDALIAAGYPSAQLILLLTYPDVTTAQHEPEVVEAIVKEALSHDLMPLGSVRPLGIVRGVAVFVRGEP